MDDDISGFVGAPPTFGEADLSSFTLIHSSEDGFFALYRGERAGLFRTYKCLKPQWRGNPLHEAMLKKEFELGYPLRHPNICETIQYTSIEGLGNCIEMEWIDGVTLREFLGRGRPDETLFRKMAGELCDALTYLHNRQTIHRDIKPSNIMVTHDGCSIKLIDFSLADSSRSALFKAPAGTRKYIAPEVLQERPADVRSDIWSLGMVLREMTCRHNRAISKCLRDKPEARWQSVQQLKEALLARNYSPAIAALLLLGVVAAAILQPWKKPAAEDPGQHAPPPVVQSDTSAVPPVDSIQRTTPRKRNDAPKTDKKAEELDRIFQQATDLFEDRLQ